MHSIKLCMPTPLEPYSLTSDPQILTVYFDPKKQHWQKFSAKSINAHHWYQENQKTWKHTPDSPTVKRPNIKHHKMYQHQKSFNNKMNKLHVWLICVPILTDLVEIFSLRPNANYKNLDTFNS